MSERKTMFGEAKSVKYADIVKMDTEENAKKSAKTLKKEFNKAKTRAKKVTVKRVTVNASNRAFASAKRKKISFREKLELIRIGHIFEASYKSMIIPSRHARKG